MRGAAVEVVAGEDAAPDVLDGLELEDVGGVWVSDPPPADEEGEDELLGLAALRCVEWWAPDPLLELE